MVTIAGFLYSDSNAINIFIVYLLQNPVIGQDRKEMVYISLCGFFIDLIFREEGSHKFFFFCFFFEQFPEKGTRRIEADHPVKLLRPFIHRNHKILDTYLH